MCGWVGWGTVWTSHVKHMESKPLPPTPQLEEVVEGEEGLVDAQRTLLRAAAYDVYDMLLMCDEFVNQANPTLSYLLSCLELLCAIAPGSESHVAVALKFQRSVTDRLQFAEALHKKVGLALQCLIASCHDILQVTRASSYFIAWVVAVCSVGAVHN